jgi:hypothetical protein
MGAGREGSTHYGGKWPQFGALHKKHAVQGEFWLLYDRGRPRKTVIELAGRRTIRMHMARRGTMSVHQVFRSRLGEKTGALFCPMPRISKRTLLLRHRKATALS